MNSPHPNPLEHNNIKHMSKKTLLTIECHKYISLNFKPPGQLFYAEIGRVGGKIFFSNHMLQSLHVLLTKVLLPHSYHKKMLQLINDR